MKPLPLPIRLAAGIAATAVERARELPTKLAGLPVTVVSQALQASMRVQQQVTELAIKGDEALAGLRPVEETPDWATFDEDDEDSYDASRPAPYDTVDPYHGEDRNGDHADDQDEPDPWMLEERAIAEEQANEPPPAPPAGLENYAQLSLPQLRARLRQFTVPQLRELLDHERATANRPSFVGMLTRRIATVQGE